MKKGLVQTSVTHPLTRAAFGAGGTPTIGFVNDATTDLGYDFKELVSALQTALDSHFVPVWGTPARLQIFPDVDGLPSNVWPFLFVDTADVAGALGYHDLTQTQLPVSFVFVQTTREDGGDVAVTASHELWEVLVDPGIQMWADGPKGQLWAYETADAVEETDFLVNNVRISNFVYPSFFELFRKRGSIAFDHLGLVSRPFQLLKGGYSIVRSGRKISQVFGSAAKEKRFVQESRQLHRSGARVQRARDSGRS